MTSSDIDELVGLAFRQGRAEAIARIVTWLEQRPGMSTEALIIALVDEVPWDTRVQELDGADVLEFKPKREDDHGKATSTERVGGGTSDPR